MKIKIFFYLILLYLVFHNTNLNAQMPGELGKMMESVMKAAKDLDANQMVGKIYIKPTKALEFIDIEFLITPTGASFENI
jgi:hypothetical protein